MKGDTEIEFGKNTDPEVRFNLVDLNKDGFITYDEFCLAAGEMIYILVVFS